MRFYKFLIFHDCSQTPKMKHSSMPIRILVFPTKLQNMHLKMHPYNVSETVSMGVL